MEIQLYLFCEIKIVFRNEMVVHKQTNNDKKNNDRKIECLRADRKQ